MWSKRVFHVFGHHSSFVVRIYFRWSFEAFVRSFMIFSRAGYAMQIDFSGILFLSNPNLVSRKRLLEVNISAAIMPTNLFTVSSSGCQACPFRRKARSNRLARPPSSAFDPFCSALSWWSCSFQARPCSRRTLGSSSVEPGFSGTSDWWHWIFESKRQVSPRLHPQKPQQAPWEALGSI